MGRVSEGTKAERFEFIDSNLQYFDIRYLCLRLGVTFQGYYQWRDRKRSPAETDNIEIAKEIKQIYHEHKGNYGSPRVCAELRRRGKLVNHKRVERIMREEGLVGKAGRIYRRKKLPENPCIKVKNHKHAQGAPKSINEQWAGDITYLKIQGRWQFLAIVMDLYSRKVIGWEMGPIRSANLTLVALKKAVQGRELKEGLIFHSDRGSEYGAIMYQAELSRLGITPSMNRPRKMIDNAHVESFFQTLKTEAFKGVNYASDIEVRRAFEWYIDKYYNELRLHSSIGFCTPVEFEALAA